MSNFPFNYTIEVANDESRLIVVKDSTETSYGVISTDGKIIMPLVNYGIAIASAKSNIFFSSSMIHPTM